MTITLAITSANSAVTRIKAATTRNQLNAAYADWLDWADQYTPSKQERSRVALARHNQWLRIRAEHAEAETS